MRKEYVTPELETVKFDLMDVLSASPTEATIPEIIGGDDDDGELEGDF